jgi:hypothetical protein
MPFRDKEKRAAYMKAYYKANREKRKAYLAKNKDHIVASKKAYYKANKEKLNARSKAHREASDKEQLAAYQKAYYKANKEKLKAYSKAFRETNKEKISIYQKAYHEANYERGSGKAYYEANKEKINAYHKAYRETHKASALAYPAKNRALKRQAILPTTDNELIKNLYKQRAVMTEENGEPYHVDHIIPLSIGGAHHQDNLRVITAKENREKHNKYTPELGGVWADNALARETKKKLKIK